MNVLSLYTTLSVTFLFLIFTSSIAIEISNNSAYTDFTLSENSPTSCKTYVTYRVRSPYSNLRTVSDLFNISRTDIVSASTLPSENLPLIHNQLLLIPITCTSNGTHYLSNVTYRIQQDDSFYSVSIKPFQNLTSFHLVEDMNPMINPNKLTVGMEIVFPLLCKCPKNSNMNQKGIRYLITYVWQPGDEMFPVSRIFQASEQDIVIENNFRNFTNAICLPILIPVNTIPSLLRHSPFPSAYVKKSKHHIIRLLAIILSSILTLLVIFTIFGACVIFLYKRSGNLTDHDSSMEASICRQTYKNECLEPHKLLPGVSGYLGKLITYDLHVIMKATKNLSRQHKVGGSVYKAIVDDQVVAVKKTRDASGELEILQRVYHANLVKLMGVSSDDYGNFFIVYEYMKNQSLDKWIFPKVPSESLSWNRRLFILLDVANGLHYMHEHTQPPIVHKDIRTSNILVDSSFKSKITNFSLAREATSSIMLSVDVFSFGVVLLEMLSGRNVMERNGRGEVVMLWKEVKCILGNDDGQKKERLRMWMDPNLKSFYNIDDALSLAILGRACTSEIFSDRPRMSEIVLSLGVITQSSPQISEEVSHVIRPTIVAR